MPSTLGFVSLHLSSNTVEKSPLLLVVVHREPGGDPLSSFV